MKIILLITICQQNIIRYNNILKMLSFYKAKLKALNIQPVFVVGNPYNEINNCSYDVIRLDINDEYTNLFLKLFSAYKIIFNKYDFDFIWKIDDDTLINLDVFDSQQLSGYDYIGGFISPSNKENFIEMQIHMRHFLFKFCPPEFEKNDFAVGNSYFLSKKALKYIVTKESLVNQYNESLKANQYIHIPEDQMFSYILSFFDIKINNILLKDEFTFKYSLQALKNYLTLHPIYDIIFVFLLNKSVEEQKIIIEKNFSLFFGVRINYFSQLERTIKDTIKSFLNFKRNLGLG